MNEKLPNFLLVGAMKSGTTSIYNYLSEHSQIYLPHVKEPRFFTSSALLKIENPKYKFQNYCSSAPFDNIDDYKKLFNNVGNEIAIGEASPHYLYTHETTIPQIKKFLGDVKILIILRNPVDRAFSAYKHNRRYDPKAPNLHEELSFENALEIEDERIRNANLPMMFYYKSLGFYYDQVKAYKDNFSDVLVCILEELDSDPLSVMKKIYSFLGVDNKFRPNIKIKYNVARSENMNYLQKALISFDNPIKKTLIRYVRRVIGDTNMQKIFNRLFKEDKSTIDNKTKNILIDEFREDILKLEKLINKDLGYWLNQ